MLGIPFPVENLSLSGCVPDGFLAVDLVVFQLDTAPAWDRNGGAFCDLDAFLVGATNFGGDKFLGGVDQEVVPLYAENSLVSWLDLEVAIPGGSFHVFQVESFEAGFFQKLVLRICRP